MQPNSSIQTVNVLNVNGKVKRWMDGGCLEKLTNLQDGVTKGGTLTDVLHERLVTDHSPHYRSTDNSSSKQQPMKQQQDKENKTDNNNSESTPKSKNKPSKQKRDATKKRQSKQQQCENENE
ncbi:hypothetical protein EJD97_015160 [Solanum chilense]|uniref:Uncharacterized protein n=1 Tax=Solanum chilense TaxID=4083 RepID=A0A6N2BCC1_SOLCI|nr:hypothetical protein EJD97_015160 [Solanum chilense]